MAQIHLVTHLTFFLVILIGVKRLDQQSPEFLNFQQATKDQYHEFEWVLDMFKWGHLAMFMTQVSGLYLKRYEYHNSAQFILVTVPIVAYGMPLVWAIYRYQEMTQNDTSISHRTQGQHFEPWNIEMWILIEVQYFFMWLCSLAIFMFFANCLKYKSIRKKPNDENTVFNNHN